MCLGTVQIKNDLSQICDCPFWFAFYLPAKGRQKNIVVSKGNPRQTSTLGSRISTHTPHRGFVSTYGGPSKLLVLEFLETGYPQKMTSQVRYTCKPLRWPCRGLRGSDRAEAAWSPLVKRNVLVNGLPGKPTLRRCTDPCRKTTFLTDSLTMFGKPYTTQL